LYVGSNDHKLYAITEDTTPPVVTIEAPATGKTITAETQFLISWEASDNGYLSPEAFTLWYTTNEGGSWNPVTTEVLGSLEATYLWNVPSVATDEAMISIECEDWAGNKGYGISGTFEIKSLSNLPTTLECERAGVNVKIKWHDCDQADIYALADQYYDYNSSSWTKIHWVTGTTEWVDADAHNHPQRYYRVAAKDTSMYALAPSGSREAVGKFDLALPNTAADPTRLFISTPLEPFNSCITAEIGNQATEGDMVGIFDINLNTIALSVYSGGVWLDAFTSETSTMEMKLGRSYAYYTETPKTVSMIGRVCDHDYVSTIEGGNIDTTCAYIAPAFPTAPKPINDSNLNNTSVGNDPTEAAAIGLFDNNWNTLGFAMHTAPTHWDSYIDTEFYLEPGRGYVFLEPKQTGVTWVQKP
jgi:hypothetical protein